MAGQHNGPPVLITPTASAYDAFLLDLDGCLWIGDDPIDGAPEALHALREAGKAIAFLTNDTLHTVEDYVRKLWRLGFQASVHEVVTVGAALQHMLAVRGGGSAFVIGSQAIVDHVADAGLRIVNNTEFAPRADLVVIARHDHFDYRELRIGTQAAMRGAELIGLTRDANFPMPDGLWPGTGAVLAALETASGRTADLIVGKPEPPMYSMALEVVGSGRVLAVGDRLDVDVAGGRAAGLDTALVLSGSTTAAESSASEESPTHTAATFADLILLPDAA